MVANSIPMIYRSHQVLSEGQYPKEHVFEFYEAKHLQLFQTKRKKPRNSLDISEILVGTYKRASYRVTKGFSHDAVSYIVIHDISDQTTP